MTYDFRPAVPAGILKPHLSLIVRPIAETCVFNLLTESKKVKLSSGRRTSKETPPSRQQRRKSLRSQPGYPGRTLNLQVVGSKDQDLW